MNDRNDPSQSSQSPKDPGGGHPPGSEPVRNRTRDLIERIRESADKLEQDGSSRGDVKLLSRTLRELRYAFKVFAPYRWHRKVTIFGSARTRSDDPAYQQAVEFGRAMAGQGWMAVTGAASGIMEAGHVGAGRENSMGLNILLPFEQEANPVIEGDQKLVHMKYFFTRKLMFVKECHAVACFPGGFGTLDEALEVLTLLQTGKRDLVPLVLIAPQGNDYWESFQEFVERQLLRKGMISPDDLALYHVLSDVPTAVNEMVRFYSNYVSMRYVRDKLVFRLRIAPTVDQLTEMQQLFGKILASGKFEVRKALSAESDEPELAEFPRLVFCFNRRDHGLLRQMINYLNNFAP